MPRVTGPYHADADAKIVNERLIAGCALGIVDTMRLEDVTMVRRLVVDAEQAS